MRRQTLAGGLVLLLAMLGLGAGPAAACGWRQCATYDYYPAPAYYGPPAVYYVPPPIYIEPPYAFAPPIYNYYRGGYYRGARRHAYDGWRGYGRADYYGGRRGYAHGMYQDRRLHRARWRR